MAPRKVERGSLIILDVGKNVSTPEKCGKSFFENAIQCITMIIERKILVQEKNHLGIILLGSEKSNISVTRQCPGAFEHIQLFVEPQTPTWDMIRNLPKKPTNFEGDWVDSLTVAADQLKSDANGVRFVTKKILLMTNFKSPSQFNKVVAAKALNEMKQDNIEVDVIGLDIYEDTEKSRDLEFAQQLVHNTNGMSVTFDYCMNFLLFHPKKAVTSIPWNVDLSFTPEIKIPVSCYIKVKEEHGIKSWLTGVEDPVTNTLSTEEAIVKNKQHVNSEKQTSVEYDDLIKGYHYGQRIIPFSDTDKTMLYQPGDKSLKVYGFTKASNLDWQHLNGNNLVYVFGRKDNKKAQIAIRCLVECLQEQNLVGIVRRVYNKGNVPKMFALMPVVDENIVGLSLVGICYKEEVKNMTFPPINLKKYQCTAEQVDAFKALIKAMDLTKAYDNDDDAEAFPIAETFSPCTQYILDCISYRALNPGKPLPPPKEEIMALFKIPPNILNRSKEPLEKIKNLFFLKKIEVKPKGSAVPQILKDQDKYMSDDPAQNNDVDMTELPKVDTNSIKKSIKIAKIGTFNPISDYKILKSNGKTLVELTTNLTEVIESILYANLDGTYTKGLECLAFFRQECVDSQPSYYNDWLKVIKMSLLESKMHDVLELITLKKLDVILKSENILSTFENAEEGDNQLYENDTEPTLIDMTINSQVNNFFDDM